MISLGLSKPEHYISGLIRHIENMTISSTRMHFTLLAQGCGLRKILMSPKVPYHKILGAQRSSLYGKSEFF